MDMGSGASPLGGILSAFDQVQKSYSIDLSDVKFKRVLKIYGINGPGLAWPFTSYPKVYGKNMISFPKWEIRYQDWFSWIEEFWDSSVDLAVDSCASHLFIKKSSLDSSNKWRNGCIDVGLALKRKLKPNGRFILISDVHNLNESCYYPYVRARRGDEFSGAFRSGIT